jgi:hypothetical protein
MFKKWTWPMIGAGVLALSLLSPASAVAQRYDRDFHHHDRARWGFSVGVGPGPVYGPGYATGFYDAWGVWHPYGYPYAYRYGYGHYDRWGHWHPR